MIYCEVETCKAMTTRVTWCGRCMKAVCDYCLPDHQRHLLHVGHKRTTDRD